MSSEGISLPRERGRPPQRTGPWSEGEGQNPGGKKEREEPGQDPEDLPCGEGEERSSAPCRESYSFSLPKKVKRAALKAALSLKRQEGKLILLNDFPLEGFKTRQVLEVLRRFQVEDALIVTDEKHLRLERSARNIPGIETLRYEGLNVYDILNHEHLILLRPTVEKIEGVLAS